MFKEIYKSIVKYIYKKSIYRAIVIDKANKDYYKTIEPYYSIAVPTNKGDFVFKFKRDRRRSYQRELPGIHSYITELVPPDNLIPINTTILDKSLVVIKVSFFKINEEILAELLAEIYVNKILKYIKDTTKS